MKKLALIAVVASAFGFTSCKKDYTCACKFSDGENINVAISKAKKKDAESTCDAAQTTYRNSDSGATCTLN